MTPVLVTLPAISSTRQRKHALGKTAWTRQVHEGEMHHIRVRYRHSDVNREMSHLESVMTQLQCSFINSEFRNLMGQRSAWHFELGTDWSPKGACTHEHTVLGCLHTCTVQSACCVFTASRSACIILHVQLTFARLLSNTHADTCCQLLALEGLFVRHEVMLRVTMSVL